MTPRDGVGCDGAQGGVMKCHVGTRPRLTTTLFWPGLDLPLTGARSLRVQESASRADEVYDAFNGVSESVPLGAGELVVVARL